MLIVPVILFICLLSHICDTATATKLIVPSASYNSLAAAFDVVVPGDIISLMSGTYEGTGYCGLFLSVSNVTLTGTGIPDKTTVICDASQSIPLQVAGNDFKLKNLTIVNSGNIESENAVGLGLVFATTSRIQVEYVIFEKGFIGNLPANYQWRTSGAALAIHPTVGSKDTVKIVIRGVVFVKNAVRCTQDSCIGGAVSILLQPNTTATVSSTSQEDGMIQIVGCLFDKNDLIATESVTFMQGAGVSINNQQSALNLSIVIERSIFENNTMSSSTVYSTNGIGGSGGAVAIANVDFATKTLIAERLNLVFTRNEFFTNAITVRNCSSIDTSSANGGAISPVGATFLGIYDTVFVANTVTCLSGFDSDNSGIAEGGAVFVLGNTINHQPVIDIARCYFESNMAICAGTGCQATCGAVGGKRPCKHMSVVCSVLICFPFSLSISLHLSCLYSCHRFGGHYA
jgi:hypothetical protein